MEETTEKNPGRGKAYRRRMAAKSKQKRWEIVTRQYISTAGRVRWGRVDGTWQQVGTHVQYPNDSRPQKALKRRSNRTIRRKKELYQGNDYRKCFEYQWNLW